MTRRVPPAAFLRRGMAILCAVLAALAFGVAMARADSYWNVWQGWLPDANGVQAKYNAYTGGGAQWFIRMSWSPTSVTTMYFLFIGNDGSWHGYDDLYGGELNGYYDRVFYYTGSQVSSGVAKAGCEIPGNELTAYTNCRNASTY